MVVVQDYYNATTTITNTDSTGTGTVSYKRHYTYEIVSITNPAPTIIIEPVAIDIPIKYNIPLQIKETKSYNFKYVSTIRKRMFSNKSIYIKRKRRKR